MAEVGEQKKGRERKLELEYKIKKNYIKKNVAKKKYFNNSNWSCKWHSRSSQLCGDAFISNQLLTDRLSFSFFRV